MSKALIVYASRTGSTQKIGDLIAEGVLAVEMAAVTEDLAHSIHAHPTLSESIGIAAEIHLGTATDIYMPKQK